MNMQIRSSRHGRAKDITYGLKTVSSDNIKLGEHVKRKLQWEKGRTTIFNLSSDNGFGESFVIAWGYWSQLTWSYSKQLQPLRGLSTISLNVQNTFFQFAHFWNRVASYKWSLSSSPEKLLVKRLCFLKKMMVLQGKFSGKEILRQIYVQDVYWEVSSRSLPLGEGRRSKAIHYAVTLWVLWSSEVGMALVVQVGEKRALVTLPSLQRTLEAHCPGGGCDLGQGEVLPERTVRWRP